ncbi:MAG: DUF4230 domain-containing protein [Burkholderiaceae bacterium]
MDLITLLGLLVFLGVGFGGGWLWHASRRRGAEVPRALTIRGSIDELRAIGELSVFRAASKDLIAHSDHTFGEFGRKYLSWAFTRKKLAMVFEFEMDFRYDLRSEAFRVRASHALADSGPAEMPGGGSVALIDMPPCRVEVSIKDLAFYDEQRSRLLPWLLPDLLQGFFDGRFSEDDKNQLIAAARAHAMAQAQTLAERYRDQVERSAYSTLSMLVRPLGYAQVEIRFAANQELATLTLAETKAEGAMPAPRPVADKVPVAHPPHDPGLGV